MSSEIDTLKARALLVTCQSYALRARWALRSAGRSEMVGPCPLHGAYGKNVKTSDRFGINVVEDKWNCRHEEGGGDVISMVMHVEGCDFIGALERITGQTLDSLRSESPEDRAAREAKAARDLERAERERLEREKVAASFRERAVDDAKVIYKRACRPDNAVAAYLRLRGVFGPGLDLDRPEWWLGMHLRELADHPFFLETMVNNKMRMKVVHRGVVMIAGIQRPDGTFGGVHQTWIDLRQPKGKALITDPATGEIQNPKKVRGTLKGGAIRLLTPERPRRLIMGEGIESTASPLAHYPQPDTAFWVGISLGNMSGKALTLPPAGGKRGRRIEDQPDPDDTDAFIAPEWCEELIFLGEDAGDDTKARKTRNAMVRGLRRSMRARPGLVGRIAWPGDGDFNDLAMEIRPE